MMTFYNEVIKPASDRLQGILEPRVIHIIVKDETPFGEEMSYRRYRYNGNELLEMGVQFDPFKYGGDNES